MNFLTSQLIDVLSAVFKLETNRSIWPLIRIYRGGFLLIEFLFLLGINTYGWRQAGVNHVLIFELNPRSNLSHQHLFEVIKARHKVSQLQFALAIKLVSWVLKSIYLKRTFDLILNTFLTFVLLKRFLSNGKTEIIFSFVLFPILCQIAGFLGILWCLSLLACFFAPISVIPTYVYPLVLYGFMVFFLINPTKTFYYKSRFWLLKLLVSPEICVPFLEWCIGHWLPPE